MPKTDHATRRGPAGKPSAGPNGARGEHTAYWSRNVDMLLRNLGTSTQGLSSRQAVARLRWHGPNTLGDGGEPGRWRLLLRQFTSPLVVILLLGAAISLGLREWTEAGIILCVVLGSALLGAWQEIRASSAVAALRQRIALNARIWRDGRLAMVPATSLVPGDVIELSAGNLVPADGVALSATDFLVTEASLTGEPFPVEKQAGVWPPETPLAGRRNCVFLGTPVRSRPGPLLLWTTLVVAVLACGLPYLKWVAVPFGFVALSVRLMAVIFLGGGC